MHKFSVRPGCHLVMHSGRITGGREGRTAEWGVAGPAVRAVGVTAHAGGASRVRPRALDS